MQIVVLKKKKENRQRRNNFNDRVFYDIITTMSCQHHGLFKIQSKKGIVLNFQFGSSSTHKN